MSDETAGVRTQNYLSADLARLMAGGECVLRRRFRAAAHRVGLAYDAVQLASALVVN